MVDHPAPLNRPPVIGVRLCFLSFPSSTEDDSWSSDAFALHMEYRWSRCFFYWLVLSDASDISISSCFPPHLSCHSHSYRWLSLTPHHHPDIHVPSYNMFPVSWLARYFVTSTSDNAHSCSNITPDNRACASLWIRLRSGEAD